MQLQYSLERPLHVICKPFLSSAGKSKWCLSAYQHNTFIRLGKKNKLNHFEQLQKNALFAARLDFVKRLILLLE